MNIIPTISWDGSTLSPADLVQDAAREISRLVGAPTMWKIQGKTLEIRWKTERVKVFSYDHFDDVETVEDIHFAIWDCSPVWREEDVPCTYGLPSSWHLPRSIFETLPG